MIEFIRLAKVIKLWPEKDFQRGLGSIWSPFGRRLVAVWLPFGHRLSAIYVIPYPPPLKNKNKKKERDREKSVLFAWVKITYV